uniref:Uncharacterized protein n=1 Tax=Panagrellus redivivus TaxID=6233 RepID=A0A7E4UP49_PANRE
MPKLMPPTRRLRHCSEAAGGCRLFSGESPKPRAMNTKNASFDEEEEHFFVAVVLFVRVEQQDHDDDTKKSCASG